MGNYDDFWKQAIDDAEAASAVAAPAVAAPAVAAPAPAPAAAPPPYPPVAPVPAMAATAAGPTPYAAPMSSPSTSVPGGGFWDAPAPAGLPPAPAWGSSTATWTQPKKSSPVLRIAGGLIGLVLATSGGYVAYEKFWSLQPMHTPQVVAGEPLNASAETREMSTELVGSMKDDGADHAVAGVYGSKGGLKEGRPLYVVGAGSDASHTDHQGILAEAMDGMDEDGIFRPAGSPQSLLDRRGRTVTCQAVAGPIQTSVCVWSHKNRVGVVIAFLVPVTDLAPITGDVRDAIL